MKKITKKENAQYMKEAKEILTSFNAYPSENYGKSENWKGLDNTFVHVSEVFGKTSFIIEECDGSIYSLYVRFENEEMRNKYKNYMGWNRVDEKYNFHSATKEGILFNLENLLFDLDITESEYIEYKAS